MRKLTTTAALGVCAVLVMAAGVAVAASSSSSAKTFSACLTNKSHKLTEVTRSPTKPRHCAAGSTKVSWNAKGVAGPRGPAGSTVTYVPLLSAAETYGCGGKAYAAEPANGCPSSPTTTYGSVQVNSADFAPGATVRLQASFIINDTQDDNWPLSEVCVRLLDVTTQKIVGKPVCGSSPDPDHQALVFHASAATALPKGNDNYKIEVGMPLNQASALDNSQGGVVTQVVAQITS